MKCKILITGFAPFGGQTVNPAYEAVRGLPDRLSDVEIVKAEIPVVFREEMQVVDALIDREKPDGVILVGQAGGRAAISMERVAINVMDSLSPDNAGYRPVDEPVLADGPAAYFSTLPIRRMEQAVRAKGIPCRISNTAGTYVCNDVMYRVLHRFAMSGCRVPAGFIHVPYLPEQAAAMPQEVPSMPLDTIREALVAALEVLSEDIKKTR